MLIGYLGGITAGYAAGFATTCNHVLCTERTQYMIPAPAIGFTLLGGTSWKLARLKGQMGRFAALTGESLIGPHALYVVYLFV
jgi:enoyl-CoA hydratase/carnithine racemase